MKKFLLSGVCCAGLMALLPETGHAHGGEYRGPGDTVPPGGGGGRGTGGPSGPTTGGPAGPSAPGPSAPTTGGPAAPTTGGPAGPAGGGAAKTGARGMELSDDLTKWSFWWEFNKDPFIRLKEQVQAGGTVTGSDDFFLGSTRRSAARDSLKPTEEQIKNTVLPALKKAIDSTDQRDIASSCMIAMAKIGVNHDEFKLIDVFEPRLKRPDQELRETAALAIGIAAIADEKEIDLLTGLALDKGVGRDATGGSVNFRTRTFALYGLGLIAYKTSNLDLKKKALEVMSQALKDDSVAQKDLKVAAVSAIGLLNLNPTADAEKPLLDDALKVLEGYYMQSLGAGDQLIQAHCPTSIAKLIGRDHPKADYYKEMFAADLEGKGKVKRSSDDIARSCVLALGQLARPYTDKSAKECPDGKYSRLLLETFGTHKDKQTKYFSILALGQIGGELNREAVLKEFDKGTKEVEKPWCALSLGVYAYFKGEADKNAGRTPEPERLIGQTLLDELKEAKTPELTGSLGVALGLAKATDAADLMRSKMLDNIAQEDVAGYLAIGLALMNDTRSTEDIRSMLPKSIRRPRLVQQAAVALGKLGDKTVADELQKLMTEGEPNLAKLAAIASALGFIGDSRTIDPLKKMLFDEKLSDYARAFAAVALGGVADKEPLRWNSKVSCNINYRAAVETLTSDATGILDLL